MNTKDWSTEAKGAIANTSERAETMAALVNHIYPAMPFRYAVIVEEKGLFHSDVAAPEVNSELHLWLKGFVKELGVQEHTDGRIYFANGNYPEDIKTGWGLYGAPVCMAIALESGETVRPVLFVFLEDTPEQQSITELREIITIAEKKLQTYKRWRLVEAGKDKVLWLACIAGVVIATLPVSNVSLAPAEVAPYKPTIITAPMDGVVKEAIAKPYQEVRANDVIVKYDEVALKARQAVAASEVAIARAELESAEQRGLSDPAARTEQARLMGAVQKQTSELQLVESLLGRLEVKAPFSGVVVYDDANDLIGLPVQVGQKIATLADPENTQIVAYLPANDGAKVRKGAAVRVFLHSDPLRPLEATVSEVAYIATPSPDGIASLKIKAQLRPGDFAPLGARGTARIEGDSVPVFYYVLRRPIATLREMTGW